MRYIQVNLPYATFGPKHGLRKAVENDVVSAPLLGPDKVQRLALADVFVDQVSRFLRLAQQRGIAWTLEHPQPSLLWYLPEVRRLAEGSHQVVYDLCSFGSPHRLRRQLLTSCPNLAELGCLCAGNHSHVPVETGVDIHPRLFCQRVAAMVGKAAGFAPSFLSASRRPAACGSATQRQDWI